MEIFVLTTLLFFFISLKLFFRIVVIFNFSNNNGKIVFKLFYIPIFVITFRLSLKYIYLKIKNKNYKLKFKFDKKDIELAGKIQNYIKKIIYISKIDIFLNVFKKNNANVVNFYALILVLEYIFYKNFKHTNNVTEICFNNMVGFGVDYMEFKLSLNLFVSVVDALLSFIKSILIRRRIYE